MTTARPTSVSATSPTAAPAVPATRRAVWRCSLAASARTRELIDDEVPRITGESHREAVRTLTEHHAQLEALAAALLEHETLDELHAYTAAGDPAARRSRS
jgi:cell division protease FtsH